MVEQERGNCTQSESANFRRERGNLPDPGGELIGSVNAGDLGPRRLIDTNAIENGRELVTVFSVVDHLRISAQDVNSILLEPEGNVLRELSWDTTVRWRKKRGAVN